MSSKAGEISSIIKEQIKQYESKIEMKENGTVITVGDGIATVYGLRSCMANELLRFEDGSFVHKGEISDTFSDVDTTGFFEYNRALYIGGYVYVLSDSKFVAADMETLEITDELSFETPMYDQSY